MTRRHRPLESVSGALPPRLGIHEHLAQDPAPPLGSSPLLVDSREVARLLGIGRTKAFQLMARGEIPVVRVGRCARVPRQALNEWVKDRTHLADHAELDR
jgi:excisionase family DNA binding protein